MHSLGALGVWRRKFQTRENLRQGSHLSRMLAQKKNGPEPSVPAPEMCRKVFLNNSLYRFQWPVPSFPVVTLATVLMSQNLQLNITQRSPSTSRG
jgi:hypothetical protein